MYYHLDRRMVLFSLVDQSFDLNHRCRRDDGCDDDGYDDDEKIFFFDVSYDHDDDGYNDVSYPSFDDDGGNDCCCYENDNDDYDQHDVENMR